MHFFLFISCLSVYEYEEKKTKKNTTQKLSSWNVFLLFSQYWQITDIQNQDIKF